MEPETRIPHKIGNYVLKRQIGKGSFATVWRAQNVLSKSLVAIKIFDTTALENEASRTRFVREVSFIKELDHPFITKLYEVIQTDEFIFLVMEYAENGSILNYVNANGKLSETQARRYFSQLLTALEYLHCEKKIAHRDLKAENVLLDKYLNIHLIDFGLSNAFTDDAPELKTACGSPAYASPEMVKGMPYTKMSDVWSAGILLYAIVTGQLPFSDENLKHLFQKIAFTEPKYPSYLTPQLIDLLKKILNKSPDQRATINSIKSHPWFSQSEYSQFLKLRFSTDESYLVKVIDKDVVDQIASYGVDVQRLPNDLICGEYNETTALYYIIRREKIADKIKETMDSLNSTPHPTTTRTESIPAIAQTPLKKMDNQRRAIRVPPRKTSAEGQCPLPLPSTPTALKHPRKSIDFSIRSQQDMTAQDDDLEPERRTSTGQSKNAYVAKRRKVNSLLIK